jgi:uncharacterized protein YyaL (SSP411 family)
VTIAAHMQELNGNWIRGNSQYAVGEATTYNVKAAEGLCKAGVTFDREDWVQAALRNAAFCLSRQQPHGWFRDCCLDDPERPVLHTIAYTVQGLLEVGRLTAREDLIAAARRTADAELELLSSRTRRSRASKASAEASRRRSKHSRQPWASGAA